ncbi:hypothetical protein H257_11138 [Aphanomyces astaci]|uniref:DDE Tnp4 domain-containing protein n=1 Tax=Aphanomyces astaci TaxID=112090 RepID=W4G395_APHAT|nr:hypothetical protein H257_11138 [Aphanomyces astaci]ETV74172.1 hypothetical protein H257_11138 [Aphanomyces astaci]|eukprot:XP_009836278.1 hypothetical protein H257_11138 [Aphanomyces astaci]
MPPCQTMANQLSGSWACLVDMGYIGIQHSLRGIHPKRRPVNGSLDASDLERNHAISSDRVIVENSFGMVCSLWKTNFHLSLMPLRREDEAFYGLVMARYQRMASEKKRKKAEAQ